MVGSVGVLQVHIDRTKQMEMDGMKATIVRSGDDKALANPYEPLSEAAKAAMQSQSDALYDVFKSHMADRRGVSKEMASKNFAGGRVFVGKQALEAGLVDEVGPYEAAFRYAAKLAERSLKKAPASNTTKVRAEVAPAAPTAVDNPPITPRNQNMDPQDLDALAALAGMEPAAADAEFDTAKLDELTAQATALQEQVTTLQEQLTAANASLAEASAKLVATAADLEAAQAAAAEAKPQFDAAIEIARASVRTMGPNFGVTAESVAAMSVAEVLATHKDVAEKFRAKFRLKTGGVAAASVEPQPSQLKPALFMAPAQASVAMSLPGA
jgi:ClpP class serine protease